MTAVIVAVGLLFVLVALAIPVDRRDREDDQ
jgi:hypothetical protein